MKKFDHSDVDDGDLTAEVREAILHVILAWPRLEHSLTFWISLALGVRPSETGLLLGAMDTKTKIARLKSLHIHRRDKQAQPLLKALASEHETHAKVRNTIAHAQLLGRSKSVPKELIFLTSRAIPDQHGFMSILRIPLLNLKEAAQFADGKSSDIRDFLKARGLKVE